MTSTSGAFPDNSADWVDSDKKYVWHPFTPMQQWIEAGDQPGRVIVGAEGFELIDQAGGRYIDGFSSLWCNLHGHRVPKIDQAIREQLERVSHTTLLGHASPPSVALAKRLVEITPASLTKVFFSDSGASAVEVALKMAYQFYRNEGTKNRRRFLALRQGYHGDTIGAVSLGGIETFHSLYRPLLFETTFIDSPNAFHHPAGENAGSVVLDQLDEELKARSGEYCAMIVEPLVQGAAGILTHPEGFLKGVRELTHRHGVLMIADEVATGFCRTGALFACDRESVQPDIMCLGKGLTGGYLPVSATLTSQAVFDAFCGKVGQDMTFYHGHTYSGNALGCSAGLASIELIFQTGLLNTLAEKGGIISRRLGELWDHRHVGNVRQCGMMVGIELLESRRPRRFFDPHRRIGAQVCLHARRFGLITRPLGDVVVLMPAPAMDVATLSRLIDSTVAAIEDFFKDKRT